MSDNWRADAECRKVGNALFFQPSVRKEPQRDRIAREAQAKAFCDVCPVAAACLAHALRRPETEGVWGGTTEAERRRMRRDQRVAS